MAIDAFALFALMTARSSRTPKYVLGTLFPLAFFVNRSLRPGDTILQHAKTVLLDVTLACAFVPTCERVLVTYYFPLGFRRSRLVV